MSSMSNRRLAFLPTGDLDRSGRRFQTEVADRGRQRRIPGHDRSTRPVEGCLDLDRPRRDRAVADDNAAVHPRLATRTTGRQLRDTTEHCRVGVRQFDRTVDHLDRLLLTVRRWSSKSSVLSSGEGPASPDRAVVAVTLRSSGAGHRRRDALEVGTDMIVERVEEDRVQACSGRSADVHGHRIADVRRCATARTRRSAGVCG